MALDYTRGTLRWTPECEDGGGIYAFRFVAQSDRLGEATTRVAVAPSGPTLVGNASFETGISGWNGSAGTSLGRSAVARSGNASLAVQGPDTPGEFGITDSPNWVASTPGRGTRYRCACWVRADSRVGRVRISVREYLNRVRVASSYSTYIDLSDAGWRKVIVDHVTFAGGSSLDLNVLCMPTEPHAHFYVDDASIRVVDAPQGVAARAGIDRAGAPSESPVLLPNPMRDRGTLLLALAHRGALRVTVYDLNGRLAMILDRADVAPGRYQFQLDRRTQSGEPLGPGVYFYRCETPDGVREGRFVVLR